MSFMYFLTLDSFSFFQWSTVIISACQRNDHPSKAKEANDRNYYKGS